MRAVMPHTLCRKALHCNPSYLCSPGNAGCVSFASRVRLLRPAFVLVFPASDPQGMGVRLVAGKARAGHSARTVAAPEVTRCQGRFFPLCRQSASGQSGDGTRLAADTVQPESQS